MLTSKICTEMQSHAFRRRRHFHRGAQREKFFDMAKQVGACVCVEDCPMPRTTKHDVELLRWWREWLHALDAEMAVTDQGDEERRHKRVEMLQRTIAKTPSEGLVGIGVKLALASFLDSFADGADGEPAMSAYRDTVRLLGRDFSAEAEAVVERSRKREVALVHYFGDCRLQRRKRKKAPTEAGSNVNLAHS